MGVGVRFEYFDTRLVGMLVAFVMRVFMLMCHDFADMLVATFFRQVQPDAEGHQRTDSHGRQRELVAHENGEQDAEKRCDRNIGSGPRGTEMTPPDGKRRSRTEAQGGE